jgi:hypothetical protein
MKMSNKGFGQFGEVITVSEDVMKSANEMMNKNPWYILSKLKQGSKILLKSGEEAIFVRLKQKKFIAQINGESWDIPVGNFVKVLEEAKDNLGYKNLKKGEIFYINNNGSAEVFKFDSIKIVNKKERIIGINPIDNSVYKIDASMYAGKISDIK